MELKLREGFSLKCIKGSINYAVLKNEIIYLDFEDVKQISEDEYKEILSDVVANKEFLKNIIVKNASINIKRSFKIVINQGKRNIELKEKEVSTV